MPPPYDVVSFIRRNRVSIAKEEPEEQDYEILEEPPSARPMNWALGIALAAGCVTRPPTRR